MNNKAQSVSVILITAIGVIVALVIFSGAIMPQVGLSTATADIQNVTITPNQDNVTATRLQGVSWSNVIVHNETSGDLIGSGNYTVRNRVLDATTGELTAEINTSLRDASYRTGNWNISGTVQPEGYIEDSAGRAVAGLIAVFAALAIAIFAIFPAMRSGIVDLIKR